MKLINFLFGRKDPESLYNQAYKNMEKDNYIKAHKLLKKAIILNPNSAIYHFSLGLCYSKIIPMKGLTELIAEQYFENSAKHLQMAVDLAAQQGELDKNQIGKACFQIGSFYQLKEDYDNSIKYLERTISLCPEIHEAWFQLSFSYHNKGEYKKALAVAKNFLINNPYDNKGIQYWLDLCKKQDIEPIKKLSEKKRQEIHHDLWVQIRTDKMSAHNRNINPYSRMNPFGSFDKGSYESAIIEAEKESIYLISLRYRLNIFEVILIKKEGENKGWSEY